MCLVLLSGMPRKQTSEQASKQASKQANKLKQRIIALGTRVVGLRKPPRLRLPFAQRGREFRRFPVALPTVISALPHGDTSMRLDSGHLDRCAIKSRERVAPDMCLFVSGVLSCARELWEGVFVLACHPLRLTAAFAGLRWMLAG